jgi:hypothetical protein
VTKKHRSGLALKPTDLPSPLTEQIAHLRPIKSEDDTKNIPIVRKLCLDLGQDEASTFAQSLKDMNISFAALFPELDGFGRSINQQIGHYCELARQHAGLG